MNNSFLRDFTVWLLEYRHGTYTWESFTQAVGRVIVILAAVSFLVHNGQSFAHDLETHSSPTWHNPISRLAWGYGQRQLRTWYARKVKITDGRIRMFRRMHGDPKQWDWQQKEEYDRLWSAYTSYRARYTLLLAQNSAVGQPPITIEPPTLPYALR